MALRPPRLGEIPTHRRVTDGTPWVERNLGEEELWWSRHGRDSIPLEGTESALLKLTIRGQPGGLQMHCNDHHPENPSQAISLPVVDPNTGRHVSQMIIDLCSANVRRPKNTPSFPYIDPESLITKPTPIHLTTNADWGTPWVHK